MDRTMLAGVAASVIRWLLPLVLGANHEIGEKQIGEAATWFAIGVTGLLSLYWSVKEKKKLRSLPPKGS